MTRLQKWSLGITACICAILVYLLAPILTPFLIAAIFAYLGDPLVRYLSKWHIPRSLAVTLVFMVMFILIIILAALVIPLIQEQVVLFVNRIPDLINWVQNVALPWIQSHIDVRATFNVNTIKQTLLANLQQTSGMVDKVVKTVSTSGVALVTLVINIVLVPVVTFYLLRDWPKLIRKMEQLIPRRIAPTVNELLSESNEVLGAFFRGQLLVMLALAVIYTTGLTLIGLDLALLIGIIIAVFSIVPLLGSIVGLMAAIAATLFQFPDMTHIIYVLVLFILGHLLENFLLIPLLIGGRVGLHPVAVIFAILAGGHLFGFFGVLLAIPAATVIMVWLRHLHRHYLKSQLYHK